MLDLEDGAASIKREGHVLRALLPPLGERSHAPLGRES